MTLSTEDEDLRHKKITIVSFFFVILSVLSLLSQKWRYLVPQYWPMKF